MVSKRRCGVGHSSAAISIFLDPKASHADTLHDLCLDACLESGISTRNECNAALLPALHFFMFPPNTIQCKTEGRKFRRQTLNLMSADLSRGKVSSERSPQWKSALMCRLRLFLLFVYRRFSTFPCDLPAVLLDILLRPRTLGVPISRVIFHLALYNRAV